MCNKSGIFTSKLVVQVVLKHGRQPESVLVDLPCTLFMIDNRNLTIIEDIARLLQFSPRISVCLMHQVLVVHFYELLLFCPAT